MGKPAIPSYGKHLTRVSLPYNPVMASRAYKSKKNPLWFIWSNKTSEHWWIFLAEDQGWSFMKDATMIAGPFDTMREAMDTLTSGIELKYYAV